MARHDVIIVGAGLAGLTCARYLQAAGRHACVLEAQDHVGGRVCTDTVGGFLLDRGFQVLLTAYPEARQILDYEELDLHPFEPGALVYRDGRFRLLADPLRSPQHLFETLRSGVGSFGDKLRIARLRRRARSGSAEALLSRPERSTEADLRLLGFSEAMVEQFLRPFLGGVFLETHLATSSRKLDFVFRMFASGATALPARGMGAIPRQLANGLAADAVRTRSPVVAVTGSSVTLASGEDLHARAIVIAADEVQAARLAGTTPRSWHRVSALYFAAAAPPIKRPILVLNGEGRGPVNHLSVLSQVAPSYAPANQALVSVTVLGSPGSDDEALERSVRAQLEHWFGRSVESWRHLRTYDVRHALPQQERVARADRDAVRLGDTLFRCGDYLDLASIDGAMRSGRLAAEAVHERLAA
jgi:phytoene dehydrogenase-like protein